MNLIKLIPYATRERIRKALFGKNHLHDLSEFAVEISCRVAFDVGAERGYESIMFAKAGMAVIAFESNIPSRYKAWSNFVIEGVDEGVELCYMAVADKFIPGKVTTCAKAMKFYNISPDLVKIDTDGDDIRVLAGFPFDTCRPTLFSVEWDEAGEVARKLDAEGYRIVYAIYKPVNRWRRAIFSRYSLTPDFQGGEWGDVVGVRPEHFDRWKQLTGISG